MPRRGPVRPGSRRPLPEHWPLTVALAGFPLWWLLGVAWFMPILLAVPMAMQLARKRRVLLPPGFAVWVLFLVWVLLGVAALGADAPGAVPGGSPFARLLIFGYRVAWYLACTVALVWLGNADPRAVSSRRVSQLMGCMFVFTTLGGLLGMLAPTLEINSLLEMVLPHGLRASSFVHSMVHLETADVQSVLGRPEARPKAPYAYSNAWGSNFALYLPFFIVAWFRDGRRWQRVLGPVVLVAAAVPVVYGLNRGLWLCLAVGGVAVLLLALRRGKPTVILATVLVLGAVLVGLLLSPLGTILQERMDNQHSNERRAQLLTATVTSAATGSPVVGFGTTRDVQGAFSSIAGGSTPGCHACGVPALGTQGYLWMVIFSQGLVGAGIFLAFFVRAAGSTWRCRTAVETVAAITLLFFFVQLPVYDALGLPMVTVMSTIALAWRERRLAAPEAVQSTSARSAWRTLRLGAPVLVLLLVTGTAAGVAFSRSKPQEFSARVSVLLAPSPVSLAADALQPGAGSSTTVDTEAALALSARSLEEVAAALDAGVTPAGLRRRTALTATPNTRVLHLDVRAGDPVTAQREVRALAAAYLSVRADYLSQRKEQTLTLLARKLADLDTPLLRGLGPVSTTEGSDQARRRSRELLVQTTNLVLLSSTSAGEVTRYLPAAEVSKQLPLGAASGAGIGLATGALLVAIGPLLRLRPVVRTRRRRARHTAGAHHRAII